MRKREIKLSFHSVPTRCVIENSIKITKKFKKLKNAIIHSFQAKLGWKKIRKREIKIIVPFRSYPTRNRKFQKNNKKTKKLINTIINSFQAKLGWKRVRKREIKIIVPFRSYATRNRKFQKNNKKNKKIN